MKRLFKYGGALLIVFICIYLFWLWLQYKGATVIQHTTASLMRELHILGELETVKRTVSKTITGEQALASLTRPPFKEQIILTITGELRAGYILNTLSTGDIEVSRDGTIIITLWDPLIFGVTLTDTGSTATQPGIITQQDIQMRDKLIKRAEELMVQEALSGTLLQEAKNNAPYALQTAFLRAGIQIKSVIIKERNGIQ